MALGEDMYVKNLLGTFPIISTNYLRRLKKLILTFSRIQIYKQNTI